MVALQEALVFLRLSLMVTRKTQRNWTNYWFLLFLLCAHSRLTLRPKNKTKRQVFMPFFDYFDLAHPCDACGHMLGRGAKNGAQNAKSASARTATTNWSQNNWTKTWRLYDWFARCAAPYFKMQFSTDTVRRNSMWENPKQWFASEEVWIFFSKRHLPPKGVVSS